MYPPSPYATPYGSYRTNTAPPGADPASTPLATVQVACSWLPYIRGALKQLLLESSWQVGSVAELQTVQGRVFDLIDLFQDCATMPVPFACPYDFIPNAQGWTNVVDSNLSPNTRGVENPGSGWETTECHVIAGNQEIRSLRIHVTFPSPVVVTTVVMQYNLVKGVFANLGAQNGIIGYLSGGVQFTSLVNSNTDPDGLNKILVASPAGVSVDEIHLIITTGNENGSVNPGGGALLTYCEIDGTGSSPC